MTVFCQLYLKFNPEEKMSERKNEKEIQKGKEENKEIEME